MTSPNGRQIVPGITVDATGQAVVEPEVGEVLFDLALQLEEPTGLPVDVQHVLAAIVLAVRSGEIDPTIEISANNPQTARTLKPHIQAVFNEFGGQLGNDD